MKIKRMELRGRIVARTDVYNEDLRRANEPMASLAEQMKKHEVELADWAKRLLDCESAKSLEVKCRVKLDVDWDQLQNQLKAITKQLESSRTRAKESQLAFHQLKEETTDNLNLGVEKCLRGFVMWKVQTLKWLKFGADKSSKNVVNAALDGTAPESSSPRAVEMSRSSE
ncbi:hypothetical protein AXG93_3006s1000 [Marchantia polymorpha subsp. ruderalis]|uniref:Uncharacterized protein n=1 Tax=Marchantia polymorpha subsp. ruderalis TaxID=1480154 RepID=A0A176W376_MARPO|nr:hypothetical protein AXG93_3006s1000 [Marchantia polymorpha subsp. ruderalis]